MDKIKCGYYSNSQNSCENSSEDETYIKNEEKVIDSEAASFMVFTGTEKAARKAFQKQEANELKQTKLIDK